MRIIGKLKKGIVVAMVISTTVGVVYAPPEINAKELAENEEGQNRLTPPEILGANTLVVNVNETTFDLMHGVHALDYQGKNITDRIKIEGELHINTPGIYYLTYTATDDLGIEQVIKRAVIVKREDQPIIEGLEDLVVETHTGFGALRGIKAYDMIGNDITNTVRANGSVKLFEPGEYFITYTATDERGVVGVGVRKIIIKTTITKAHQAPEVLWETKAVVPVGGTFDPYEGIYIKDYQSGDLTRWAKIIGEVNTQVSGTYTVRYIVENREGLVLVHDREIIVE